MREDHSRGFWPKGKVIFLICLILLYLAIGAVLHLAVREGIIDKAPRTMVGQQGNDTILDGEQQSIAEALSLSEEYFDRNFVRKNGHIDLYRAIGTNKSVSDLNTNSEAVSYYLLVKAKQGDKQAFDRELDFIASKMAHPRFGYLMWRLTENDTVIDDGSNIATDADLRAIKALLIAEAKWGDERYTREIAKIASALERIGITKDGLLAPYGGVSGETSVWTANEVWLSYGDFTVFKELAERRGKPWDAIYQNMKAVTLDAQIHNGLYNSQLTERREYGNGIDGGGYSINSMWIMVRNAESADPDLRASANRSLAFYKKKFEVDGEIYAMYSSNGDAMSPSDTPWAYALVGRAAVALGDAQFATLMVGKLLEKQIGIDDPAHAGALPEGSGADRRVGQFTMQESILTLQDFVSSSR